MTHAQILINHVEFYGRPLNQNQIRMWVEDLRDLPVHDVQEAVRQLQREPDRSWPATPAQIRQRASGFVGAEEAWSLAPKGEDASAVITQEVALALQAAMVHIRDGDMVAARMAFKEVYEKEVRISMAKGARARWFASLGHSQLGRDEALMEAVERGRLTASQALSYNPMLAIDAPRTQLAIAAPKDEMSEEKKQERIKQLQDLVGGLGKKMEDT